MSSARQRFLLAVDRLHRELADVAEQAADERDIWVGLACGMVRQAVDDAAQAADVERKIREGHT